MCLCDRDSIPRPPRHLNAHTEVKICMYAHAYIIYFTCKPIALFWRNRSTRVGFLFYSLYAPMYQGTYICTKVPMYIGTWNYKTKILALEKKKCALVIFLINLHYQFVLLHSCPSIIFFHLLKIQYQYCCSKHDIKTNWKVPFRDYFLQRKEVDGRNAFGKRRNRSLMRKIFLIKTENEIVQHFLAVGRKHCCCFYYFSLMQKANTLNLLHMYFTYVFYMCILHVYTR